MSIAHYVVPAALVAFRRQHPRIYIQMREGIASDVLEDVRNGTADFGIGSIPERHREIAVTSVVEEPCYVTLPASHRLAHRASVRLRDLAGEPMISMPPDSGLRRLVDAVAHAENATLHHSIITNQFPSLFDFVAKGLGVSIVPASSLSPSLQRFVSSRPLRPALTRRVGILHLADRQLSAASLAFLEIFRPMFLASIRGKRGYGGKQRGRV
jgi:DNA-binding transcriptional LysR family regulator